MQNEFDVAFNANLLTNIPYVFFMRRFPNDLPDAEFKTYDMVRQDGQVNLGKRYKTKIVTFEVYIVAPNREQYEIALDTLKRRTRGVSKALVISQSGQNRQYISTLKAITHSHIEQGKATLIVAFECSYPFGMDTTSTPITIAGITVSPFIDTTPFAGSAPANPTITVNLNTFTGGGTRDVTIYNSRTGQGITVSREYSEGDQIKIFTRDKYVTLNGAVLDYDGVFPSFEPELDFVSYADTFTARDVDVDVSYLREFL